MARFWLVVVGSVATLTHYQMAAMADRGELFSENGQKDYTEQEDGKLVPHRTFLNTVEITLICVFTVLAVFLLIGLGVYLYIYGCRRPPCCEPPNKDYMQVQLQRERQIGEIWSRPPDGVQHTNGVGQSTIIRPAA